VGPGRSQRTTLLEALRREPGLVIGDNEPYSGKHPANYTIDHHAKAIASRTSASKCGRTCSVPPLASSGGALLARIVGDILADPSSRQPLGRSRPMADHVPPLTVGVEEEYLLVDVDTRAGRQRSAARAVSALHDRTDGRAFPEFLRSQIEVATPVCRTIAEARTSLVDLRRAWSRNRPGSVSRRSPRPATRSPLSSTQKRTDKERYVALLEEMQGVARRMMICGLHVHVGIDDDELRIDLMNQARYFLPHLLALSCSSPFWEGSARADVVPADDLQRHPAHGAAREVRQLERYRRHNRHADRNGYSCRHLAHLVDLRPSARYPTLETRVMDSCTSLEDSVRLAALNHA
jgi:carboxylate-amine ligase